MEKNMKSKRSEDRRPCHNLSLLTGLAARIHHPQANDLLDVMTAMVMQIGHTEGQVPN